MTPRVSKQIKHDISVWACEKLAIWINDVLMRFNAVEVSQQEALARCTRIMMHAFAGIVATSTTIEPAEAGAYVATMIEKIRAKAKAGAYDEESDDD